jgi:hypothetical protein
MLVAQRVVQGRQVIQGELVNVMMISQFLNIEFTINDQLTVKYPSL